MQIQIRNTGTHEKGEEGITKSAWVTFTRLNI